MNDCDHEEVIDQERAVEHRPWGSYPVGIVGTCKACGCAMVLEGDEDEEGHPTWTVAEDWTPEELIQIAAQSGIEVRRA
jgi:hypothetical protein